MLDRYKIKQDVQGYLQTTGRKSYIYLYDIEGKKSERLTKGKTDESSPAWSPDGKEIVCAVSDSDAGGDYMTVTVVRAENGTQTRLTSQRWSHVGQLAWLSDGSGLIMPT